MEETRQYHNPTPPIDLYQIKWHMENVRISSSPRKDYPLSLNAKAKDGGRTTSSVEMSQLQRLQVKLNRDD